MTPSNIPLPQRVGRLLDALNHGLVQKRPVLALSLLAALAGESVFLLGRPGVAKSLIARRLKFAFEGASAFEYLMNRFSAPDEIFGPVSILKLKDLGKYERLTKGYLPEAEVVFLDEIWKAGPSIQNALLTVLNERVFRNGDHELPVPMRLLIAASNELPEPDNGLEALWDRFLLRLVVTNVRGRDAFEAMSSSLDDPYLDNVEPTLKISADEYRKWQKELLRVEVPPSIFDLLHLLRSTLENHSAEQPEQAIYVSDRRWRKLVRLLRACAFFNGRQSVQAQDCLLLADCLWDKPEQAPLLRDWLAQALREHGLGSLSRNDALEAELADWENLLDQGLLRREMVVETERVVHGERFHEVLGLEKQFPGCRMVRVEDFERLEAPQDQPLQFHDSQFEPTKKLYAKLGPDNLLLIDLAENYYRYKKRFDYDYFREYQNFQAFPLDIRRRETQRAIALEPSESWKSQMLDRAAGLRQALAQRQEALANFLESNKFEAENLFVVVEQAQGVIEQSRQAGEALRALLLRLEIGLSRLGRQP